MKMNKTKNKHVKSQQQQQQYVRSTGARNRKKTKWKNLTWACTCSLCCITKVKYLTINSRWKNTRQTKQTNQWFYSRCALWFWLELDSSRFFVTYIWCRCVIRFHLWVLKFQFFSFCLHINIHACCSVQSKTKRKKKWSKTNLENQR